jgi:hypothetical protein
MTEDRVESTVQGKWSQFFREWLASIIVVTSIVCVAVLAGLAIKGQQTKAQDILTMVLPMIGTWVGTVLAFYFGREQMQAATASVTALKTVLAPEEEKLRSIKVTEKWISRASMFVVTEDPSKVKLLEVIGEMSKAKKGHRLPVLTSSDNARCVIHRSIIDRFIVEATQAGKTGDELKVFTLADMMANKDLKKFTENTFAIVSESDSLSDAKRAMKAIEWCQDVFVTRRGTSTEPVTGWITNAIIEANSKV